jgi:hypothetical protein
MPYQTSLNGAGDPSPSARMGRGVGGLLHDLVELGELQTKLVVADAKEGTSRTTTPIVLIVVAAVTALAALPILLGGVAVAIAEFAQWSTGLCLLAVGGIALVLAALMAWIAISRLKGLVTTFDRSRSELACNVEWLKQVLASQDHGLRRSQESLGSCRQKTA